MHDVVIRNGFIIDGTGRDGFEGDVAIDGGRITAVGVGLGRGREEIDARGLLVTPGFVDMHTHYDGQATWDPWLTPSGWHGVTTAVVGNCGVGFAPVRREDRDWLIQVMEGVEDIPGAALSEGIRWEWESFPEYLDALERRPFAVDIGTQMPHSALRGFVMGRDRSEDDQATPAEIAEMKRLVADSLRAGALGFSTSRTSLHKTMEGKLVAGTNAAVDELFGIGEALAETGLGVFEVADEHVRVPDDLVWMEALANQTGRPVLFNLSQTDFAPDLWRDVVTRLDAACARGADLWAQSAGRAVGILMNWRLTAHPFAMHPTFVAMRDLPRDEMMAQLADPDVRRRILSEAPPKSASMVEYYIMRAFDKMFLFTGDYEPKASDTVAARAAAEGRDPLAVAYDALLANNGDGYLYFPLFNFSGGTLDALHVLHQHPRVLMGLSDGGAHCGAICDGGVPTFMLSHWGRDRVGARLPLPHLIRRQTHDTAAFYGLRDRGVLLPGFIADINVIDFDRLRLGPPRVAFDLPAGGRRLVQAAEGYRYTLKNGVVTVRDDVVTGATPGGLLRGARPAPGPIPLA
jgi:N-acyl-D-amino-acid deacylase